VIEITSLGAAYLAGLAVGYWKSSDEIKKCWKTDKIFKPGMARKNSEKLYNGWLNAIRRTLSHEHL
jgi:glycerol kinase